MKTYILANGEAKRWGNYRGFNKQFIPIDGERLIDRTIRLLHENGLNTEDILISSPIEVEGATQILTESKTKREVFEEIGILSNELYGDETFIILYGDCYYTEAIIKDLVNRNLKQYGEWFTIHPNPNTGKPWAEGYAHKIIDVEWFINNMKELNQKVKDGEINYSTDWTIHWYLLGVRDNFTKHPVECYDPEKDIPWCDETDDFDYPIDLEHFLNVTGHKGAYKNDFVSVIIPHYNTRKYCEPLLDKLIYQRDKYYPETEIILVDDGSDDKEWLQKYEDKIKVVYVPENKGVSHARNIGLDESHGDYIQFVDSDDDISDDFLHIIYTNMRTGADYCLYRWFFNGKMTQGDFHKDSLLWNWAVWGYTFHRAVIGTARFDENLKVTEDLDFLKRIIFPYQSRLLVEKPIYYYNFENQDSLSHRHNRGELK